MKYSILALAMILILGCGSVLAVFAESGEETAAAETGATKAAEEDAGTADSGTEEKSITDIITSVGTTQAFTMEEVPEEDIQAILQAGLSAASAINQQPWFLVAVTNQDIMEEISGTGMGGKAGSDSKPEGTDMPAPPDDAQDGNGASASTSARASLGDSPLAIIVYKNPGTSSPNPDYDCGLATQNMVLAAASMGYGVKIVSSPTMSLNGEDHDQICEKLGVDPSLEAVAVLLIGKADDSTDAVSSASTRETIESRTVIIH